EVSDNLSNYFITQRRVIRRNITGKERCLGFKQSSIILEVDARFSAKALEPLQKSTIAVVSATRMSCALNPAQLIKVMQFLYRRHPEIRMGIELLIKPGGSGFMGPDTEKIGPCTASRRPLSFLKRSNHTRIGCRSRPPVAGRRSPAKNHIVRAIVSPARPVLQHSLSIPVQKTEQSCTAP